MKTKTASRHHRLKWRNLDSISSTRRRTSHRHLLSCLTDQLIMILLKAKLMRALAVIHISQPIHKWPWTRYHILEPRWGWVSLPSINGRIQVALNSLSQVQIGSLLSNRLDHSNSKRLGLNLRQTIRHRRSLTSNNIDRFAKNSRRRNKSRTLKLQTQIQNLWARALRNLLLTIALLNSNRNVEPLWIR